MKKVKCRICQCEIYAKYNQIDSLNESTKFCDLFTTKKKVIKYISELSSSPSEDINTEIYLTCEHSHVGKYYCKVDEKEDK